MSHYCDRFSCPEYNHGQCFGGGCKANPMPKEEPEAEPDEEGEVEDGD